MSEHEKDFSQVGSRMAYKVCGNCVFYKQYCKIRGVLVTSDCETFKLRPELRAKFEEAKARAADSLDIGVWDICPNCESYRESCKLHKEMPEERYCEEFELRKDLNWGKENGQNNENGPGESGKSSPGRAEIENGS